ncbi:MAG TPA: ATPase [Mycobacterium sp.]|nr:ATPase [Mycobacterium sp.]
MADKGDVTRTRPAQKRLRTLAQAALNADLTVGQVDALLEGLSETLTDLDRSTDSLDATLERFNATINRIDDLAPRLVAVIDRMEGIVDRVERIVGVGESVVSPIAATETAVKNLVNAVRSKTGL